MTVKRLFMASALTMLSVHLTVPASAMPAC